MTKSYEQILKQIETLQLEAEKLRRKELGGVIERIREAVAHYGLTAADLGLGAAAPKAAKAPKAVAAKKRKPGKAAKTADRAVKFRDEAGNTWVGRGKRPDWLRAALANGKTLNDFAVQ